MDNDDEQSAQNLSNSISDNDLKNATVVTAQATVAAARATRASTRVALLSLIFSGLAVVGGLYSVYIARQQNIYSERQSLLSLVTNIAQEPQLAAQAAESIKRHSMQLHNVDVQIQLTSLGEGQEADNLIQQLPRSAVSSVEKYQVGLALEDGDDYQPALSLLTSAAREASDPRTAADAWREAARILYTLRLNTRAERDIVLAEQAFKGPDVPQVSIENSRVDTELFDVPFQVFIKCPTALDEWDHATGQIASDARSLSIPLKSQEIVAKRALVTTCHVPARTLKVVPAEGRP